MKQELISKRNKLAIEMSKIMIELPIVGYDKYLPKRYYELQKEVIELTKKINEMESE